MIEVGTDKPKVNPKEKSLTNRKQEKRIPNSNTRKKDEHGNATILPKATTEDSRDIPVGAVLGVVLRGTQK